MNPIIEVKNISKKYNINHQNGRYIALRDIMGNAVKNPFGFLKRKTKETLGLIKKEEFWALKDLNFEINQGEVVGIIGRNGAGKSTLLKIISRITPPTTGEIKIKGSVGSLLEVGTGFHPELTGKENIFLNGAILGMPKKEIVKKFDQIVDFAGIEKFLDTPVKYYSSGMYVRLAFSVAAHLEPDILLVDEVLAVGDAEFQKKCLGKMQEVTQKEGRTILFVSHNIAAVKAICNRGILLHEGRIKFSGEISEVIGQYLNSSSNASQSEPLSQRRREAKCSLRAKLIDIKVVAEGTINPRYLDSKKPFTVYLTVQAASRVRFCAQLIINDGLQNLSYLDSGTLHNKFYEIDKGSYVIECRVSATDLYAGNYQINCVLGLPAQEVMDFVDSAYEFSVRDFDPYNSGYNLQKNYGFGFYNIDHQWGENVKKLSEL